MNVVRGGSAWNGARYCRSAYRYANDPGFRSEFVGFRTKAQPATIIARGASCLSKTEKGRAAIRFVEEFYDWGRNRGFRSKAS